MGNNLKMLNKIVGVCELMVLLVLVACQGWAYGYKEGRNDKNSEDK